ncbi:hypothetical protein R5H30_11155 [Sulfitobacter sp. D35]|uniref:hypothetical protein n=1 Tax=Sulfitobacter sp. D35 TaxID=3083252 RepID=UPI00296FC92D|nr:hypothetical protein [Sulfitobacter sp. D35]MDW4498541.1 hypothetical protein [Sulfitobacter sp. D35]
MDAIKTTEYARALYRAHGDAAEAEAAKRARDCQTSGKTDEAQNWQAIRRTIHELRGPNQG